MARKRTLALQASLFVLPAIILLLILVVYPTLRTILMSFYEARGLRLNVWIDKPVGLANYITLANDRLFRNAIFNNILWIILYVPLCICLGLLIATLANRVRYESVLKSIIFLPQGIAATAVGIIWLFMYSPNPNLGVINAVLNEGGITPIAFIDKRSTVNIALIMAHVWASTGFAMVILSAALKGIPTDVVEAAKVDGASELQIFFRITVPLISLTISVIAVTLLINVIKLFDLIYIMSKGGPSNSSRVIAFTMYRETFEGGKGGYGAAVAVIMLILILPIMYFNIRRFRAERIV